MGCKASQQVTKVVEVDKRRFLADQSVLEFPDVICLQSTKQDTDGHIFCNFTAKDKAGRSCFEIVDDGSTIRLAVRGLTLAYVERFKEVDGDKINDGIWDLDGYTVDIRQGNGSLYTTMTARLSVSKAAGHDFVLWQAYQPGSANIMFEIESGNLGPDRREVYLAEGFFNKGPLLAGTEMRQWFSWDETRMTMPGGVEPASMLIMILCTALAENSKHLRPGPRSDQPQLGPRQTMRRGMSRDSRHSFINTSPNPRHSRTSSNSSVQSRNGPQRKRPSLCGEQPVVDENGIREDFSLQALMADSAKKKNSANPSPCLVPLSGPVVIAGSTAV